MGYLIAADPIQHIFYSRRMDLLPTKFVTKDVKLLDEHRKDYTLP